MQLLQLVFTKKKIGFHKHSMLLELENLGYGASLVGIGMIGALMTIAAHRAETGYALAQISMLLTLLGGSTLIVRGVESSKLQSTMYMPGALLIISLFIVESLILRA